MMPPALTEAPKVRKPVAQRSAPRSKKVVQNRKAQKAAPVEVEGYDTAADDKKRISLRGASTKYFRVSVMSDGSYVFRPRVLVAPEDLPARTRRMLEQSVAGLKRGRASAPIDLSAFR